MTPADLPKDRFVCSHVGSLYASRNPVALWRVLGKLYRQGEIPDLHIKLAGPVDASVRSSIHEEGLSPAVTYLGYLDHPDATALMKASHVLLLSIENFPHNEGMITGKLYEYLASGRPVLGLGPKRGDASALIRNLKAGNMFDRSDTSGMRKALMDAYTSWSIGNELKGASVSQLEAYTRRAQTGVLANVLHAVTARN